MPVTIVSQTSPLTVVVAGNPKSGPVPLNVDFACLVIGGAGLLVFEWDFGDGGTSSVTDPSYLYDVTGTYIAVCKVTDLGSGATAFDTVTIDVLVDETPVIFGITANPLSGTPPLVVDFACVVAGGNLPLTFVWDFGDGNFGVVPSLAHTYTDSGTYEAECEVTDVDGDQASAAVLIDVLIVVD